MLMTAEHREILKDVNVAVTRVPECKPESGLAGSNYWAMLTELHDFPLRLLTLLQCVWDDEDCETPREDMSNILDAWILEHGHTASTN